MRTYWNITKIRIYDVKQTSCKRRIQLFLPHESSTEFIWLVLFITILENQSQDTYQRFFFKQPIIFQRKHHLKQIEGMLTPFHTSDEKLKCARLEKYMSISVQTWQRKRHDIHFCSSQCRPTNFKLTNKTWIARVVPEILSEPTACRIFNEYFSATRPIYEENPIGISTQKFSQR